MSAKTVSAVGDIHISKEVFKKISGQIALGCYGVVGTTYRNKADGIANLLRHDSSSRGISVAVDGNKIIITMHIMVEYGVNIRAVCKSIISNVKYQINNLTGFVVDNVIINVETVRH